MFYCLWKREAGAALIVFAPVEAHKEAIYSLAIIVFNGNNGTRDNIRDNDVALCARGLSCPLECLRELGFCI